MNLFRLLRAGVSRSVGDEVALELSMYCTQTRCTPLKVDGGGGGVVSCKHCRLTTGLCNIFIIMMILIYLAYLSLLSMSVIAG